MRDDSARTDASNVRTVIAMPSPQTLFLHIGTEKTGTTTLQSMFSENRERLAATGLLYPRTPGEVNHVGSALYALNLEDRPDLRSSLGLHTQNQLAEYRETFLDDLAREAQSRDCPFMLISNEHLSSRVTRLADIQRLVEGLQKLTTDIRVVVYLRPQYELAPSWYSTSVKSGNTELFDPPASDGDYFYNYDKLLRNWEAAVSQSNITVRIFDRESFVGGSLFDDFFFAIGVKRPNDLVIPADKNKSLDASTLEFLRIANRHVPWFVEGAQNNHRPALLHDIEAISGKSGPVADPKTLANMDALFKDSNRCVAERYFPERVDLFAPFPFQPVVQGGHALSAAQAVDIAIRLWRCRIDKPNRPRQA